MFSPNQLYDYLRYYCYTNKKNGIIRNFEIDGSKNLLELGIAENRMIGESINTMETKSKLCETCGYIDMFDQEPVDINAYYNNTYHIHKKKYKNDMELAFDTYHFVFSKAKAIYTPIICHSEVNSNDIKSYTDNFYTPVHFWSNAITGRYWYSEYELLTKINNPNTKRFGCYIRDTSGTRKYRKKLLDFLGLKNIRNNVFCPILDNSDINISSDKSASIEWNDHRQFDIQIVPETLFDTEKTHLTEKILKAIVMYQPFIVVGTPNSLNYLKKYGFKTFNNVWAEDYDCELLPDRRFYKITKLIKKISSMDNDTYSKMLNKTKEIVEFNRNHFYSDKFKKILLNELHDNLDNALDIQEENFYKIPGGTLFYYHDMYVKKTNDTIYSNAKYSLHDALKYAYQKSEITGDAIVKKYKHLL